MNGSFFVSLPQPRQIKKQYEKTANHNDGLADTGSNGAC